MLILGSYGFRQTQMRQKLGELIPDQSGKMLIIPLASMFGTDYANKEKTGASLLDFDRENIYIFDEDDPGALLDMQFDYIDVIGGNTFKLLYLVRRYGLDRFIRQQTADGAIYLGFSAGAYLACPDVAYVRHFDDNDLITDNDFTALGLTDKYVLCHYNQRGPREIRLCRDVIGDEPELLTIDDDQLIVLP